MLAIYLLPDFSKAHRPREQRIDDDIQLLAVPQPPFSSVRDLYSLRFYTCILATPSVEPAARIVAEAQPNLGKIESKANDKIRGD